jgi:hypothetical protein
MAALPAPPALSESIDRARVSAALAVIADKFSRREIHADHCAAWVALRAYDRYKDACCDERVHRGPPGAELFYVPIRGEEPISRVGDVLVGFCSDCDAEASLRVGSHALPAVRVPGVRDGGVAYALDGGGVLPLIALAYDEVCVRGLCASPGLVMVVMAHMDWHSRRDLAVFGGRHRDRIGRALLIGGGELHVAKSDAEPHRICKEAFTSESRFHVLTCLGV